MYRFLTLLFAFLISFGSFSQELNCRVSVVSQKIQGTNKNVFQDMQKAIFEFMNNTKWTNNVFSIDERIECNILINLTDQISSDEFKGTIQVQGSRPVFNTNYNSVLLNYMDKDFHVTYQEFQPMDFSETTHLSSLTSILAFYAYVVIGLDYDTFSPEAGTEFFAKAEKIVTNAQNAKERGWKAFESTDHKNRYWLIENLLSDKYSPLRKFYYEYHRLGFDVMSDKASEGRSRIAEGLKLLQKIYREKPDPYMHLLRVVMDAKSEEFIKIFSESFPDEKARVTNILQEIDPANSSKYAAIRKTN